MVPISDHLSRGKDWRALALSSVRVPNLAWLGIWQVLEGALLRGRREVVQEVVLRNLSCMYDLYSPERGASCKSRLETWAATAGPEDLEIAGLRTPVATPA